MDNPSVFRIVFERHPTAEHFWKDLMVHLIAALRQANPDVKITMVYRGDTPHNWNRPMPV